MPVPKFLYFDLGKVLIDFSHDRMCRQLSDVAGIAPQRVLKVLDGGLQADYESGRISSRGFYEGFCRRTETSPEFDAFAAAGNDIFTPNVSIQSVVAQLSQAGHRMGILSNTCPGHWEYCLARYRIIAGCFSIYALSFEIGACKPDAAIFLAAAKLVGCRPEEIFYTDDIAGHVAGARAVGFDAVVYTSTAELVSELRRRGVEFNY